ncbi:pilus assembly protein [Dyella subtropica]|uniref:pilus assembly protein n=1 Tax=Dyella subtropica TaxID=2992127 RepID=UPI00225816F0|nr:PilC/PilY family type IV pilus protein [Dyella subtropica]
MSTKYTKLMCFLAGLLVSNVAAAVTYTDNFSGKTASLKWTSLNDACLTAGDGTGTIPACPTTIAKADAAGYGALRLTPAQNGQTGAILSQFTFPSNQGLQVTFTTYTYGGDKGGTAKNGADGISFLLTDGTATAPTVAGGLGGSMGYSCSNSNSTYEGLANAYLGLGIDEFGNFLNRGDNTSSGIYNTNSSSYTGGTAYGTNTYSNSPDGSIGAGAGPQYQPERIGLRGAGNTTWAWLQSQNSAYYSGSVSKSKVQAACKSGQYVSGVDSDGNQILKSIPYNYAVIPGGYRVLPNSQPIASNKSQARIDATNGNAWPITYKLVLSSTGLLNFSYSYNNGAYQPVLVNSSITSSNGPIPNLFRFGFSAGTGGSNNVHEITCFQASPLESNSSAGANTVQSGQVRIGTQIYLASYASDNWWGSLVSAPVVTTGGVVSVSSTANWDAKCKLTGGGCPSMGTDSSGKPLNTITVQGPTARTLLTSDSSTGAGEAFQWASLNAYQRTALDGSDSAGQSRLAWLRGDRTVEQLQSPPGTLRARTAVLGDIIDSSPTWVGAPTPSNYPDAFGDFLYGNPSSAPENATGAQAYSAFASTYASRQNVVYVGSNDGFLHGFRAGTYKTDGSYDSSTNDGKEVIGYMPSGQLAQYAADLTNPNYVHDFVVDATPVVGDLFYGKKWHTWLVGGVGSGGSEIYALDITDPSTFAESGASSTVRGDWTSATTGLSHLANTVGTPVIARLHNGQWAIIFGNGIGGTQTAGIYIGLVDSTSGAITFQFLDTGVGSATSPDGIAYVSSVDLDGDHIADYVYAGDVQGNVWRFDLTSKDSTKWAVSQFGTGAATPLFVAQDAASTLQPITTAATVASVQSGGGNRVMVLFGTGQKTPVTSSSGDVYASGTQTFYGIWDWDMGAWNGLSTGSAYASLTGTQSIGRTNLLQQTLASTSNVGNGAQVLGYRSLSTANQVCWSGSSTCTPSTNNTQYGWYFDFPDSQEQVVYNPVMVDGTVVVSSAEPPVVSALQCNPGLQTGWTMAFDPASGGGLKKSFFPDANGSYGSGSGSSSVSGIRLDAVGSPTTVRYGGQTYIVTQTIKGSAALSKVNPPSGNSPSRVSWREIKL